MAPRIDACEQGEKVLDIESREQRITPAGGFV
jgi:hypothetical protein